MTDLATRPQTTFAATDRARTVLIHLALAVVIGVGLYAVSGRIMADPVTQPHQHDPGAAPLLPTPHLDPSPVPDGPAPDQTGSAPSPPPPATPSGHVEHEPRGFLTTWAPCSTVEVLIDESVPDSLTTPVGDEAVRLLSLAGLTASGPIRADLGPDDSERGVRAVPDGHLAIAVAAPGELGPNTLGTAQIAERAGHTSRALVLVDPALLGDDDFVAVLRHELGHAAGLPHVDDPTHLMYPSRTWTSPGDFQPEEVARLDELARRPCRVSR